MRRTTDPTLPSPWGGWGNCFDIAKSHGITAMLDQVGVRAEFCIEEALIRSDGKTVCHAGDVIAEKSHLLVLVRCAPHGTLGIVRQ